MAEPLEPLATSADLTKFRSGDPDTIMRQVGAGVREWCGWHIAPSITQTVRVDGAGGRSLWLPTLLITAVTAITNDGQALDVDADIDWSADGWIELRHRCWSHRPRSIEVTMTHGHVSTPENLVGLIAQIASRAVSSPTGTVREQAGSVSLQHGLTAPGVAGGIALLQHEVDLLDAYALPPRP